VQTDGVKERLFETAVQEQQKTLPIDHVVKNGYGRRGHIWHDALYEGEKNIPTSAHSLPHLLPAAGCGCIIEEERDKDRGKQIGLRRKDRQTERQNHV